MNESTRDAGFLTFMGPTSELGDAGSRTTPEQFAVPPPWIPFPSNLRYRLHEAKRVFDDSFTTTTTTSGGLSDSRRAKLTVEGCTAVAVRTSPETEPRWLTLLPQLYNKTVIPVGLLPPPPSNPPPGKPSSSDDRISKWLDGQRAAAPSVVYVAFGSEATLTGEQVEELALGLELSGLPFLWALRGGGERSTVLPQGFEERTGGGRGMVVRGWVPQLEILGHRAVGGFLSHCGWSSVVESLQFGRPLVVVPIFADQGINARMVEEGGYGLEVEREEESGRFTREAVARAVRVVVVEEEGEKYRRRAREMREILQDTELQERYVDGFVGFMLENRRPKS